MANQECCGGYQVAKVLLDEEKKNLHQSLIERLLLIC